MDMLIIFLFEIFTCYTDYTLRGFPSAMDIIFLQLYRIFVFLV